MAHILPFRRRRQKRQSFATRLVLAAGGGFVGALAALQLLPVTNVAADVGSMPMRSVAAGSTDTLSSGRSFRANRDTLNARFSLCHSGGGINCVIDGDTFWFGGEKIRIMDIDTPETHPARCAEEQRLGDKATARLHEWLNAGAFSLEQDGRDTDRYGRRLRVVVRDGQSVGAVLIGDGLARPWEGRRRPWC